MTARALCVCLLPQSNSQQGAEQTLNWNLWTVHFRSGGYHSWLPQIWCLAVQHLAWHARPVVCTAYHCQMLDHLSQGALPATVRGPAACPRDYCQQAWQVVEQTCHSVAKIAGKTLDASLPAVQLVQQAGGRQGWRLGM